MDILITLVILIIIITGIALAIGSLKVAEKRSIALRHYYEESIGGDNK